MAEDLEGLIVEGVDYKTFDKGTMATYGVFALGFFFGSGFWAHNL